MKIAVVGSRTFTDFASFSRVMRDCIKRGDIIISGAARGADALAKRWADENGFDIVEYPADWAKLGPGAGFARNRTIIGECDQCIAFWDGKSPGVRTFNPAVQGLEEARSNRVFHQTWRWRK